MDDAALQQRLDDNCSLLERFARTWQAVAAERYPQIARFVSPPAATSRPLTSACCVPSASNQLNAREIRLRSRCRRNLARSTPRSDLRFARLIGDDVNGAGGIGFLMMDGGRNDSARDGQRRHGRLNRTRRAEAVTDHRLDRRDRHAAEAIPSTRWNPRDSAASFCGVAVPCALM